MLTKDDLREIRNIVKSEVESLKEDVKKVREDQNAIIAFFDTSLYEFTH